jgi:hypothetical protein
LMAPRILLLAVKYPITLPFLMIIGGVDENLLKVG